MGTTFLSIHAYTDLPIENTTLEFRSFSDGWQTCVSELLIETASNTYNLARALSKKVNVPILLFYMYDSDSIEFYFFQNGKCVARYSDDEFTTNKNIYRIPALVGYGDGYKKRFSNILGSNDAEEKTEMLEEYFGVCLLPFSEINDSQCIERKRGDSLYKCYIEQEKILSGKSAPVEAKLISEYPGKLFNNYFGMGRDVKDHCFLYGFDTNSHDVLPIRFINGKLEPMTKEEFEKDRRTDNSRIYENLFEIHYENEKKDLVTFTSDSPDAYVGKTMTLPRGAYPYCFDSQGRLILEGVNKLYIVDETLKIIAKISIKGDIADFVDDYILVTLGDSFCGYYYEPKAKICIYKLIDKECAECKRH